METLKEKMLCLLEKNNWTINELSQLLDRSPGCIRGMLSIMRKEGLIDVSVEISKDCRSRVFYVESN